MGHHQEHHVDELALYEGDQGKLYSGVYNHHAHEDYNSPASKAQIKKIWMITLWLTVITVIELVGGFYEYFNPGASRIFMITFFFVFTLFKAYLIVKVFMHLGDEVNNFVMTVIGPLLLFIWFIIAFLYDADYSLYMNQSFGGWKEVVESAAH